MRTRPSVRPEALRAAASFPTLDAIFTRRARRFALGAEMTGPARLQVREGARPARIRGGGDPRRRRDGRHRNRPRGVAVPLRGRGPTGADKLATFTGRPYPSPLAQHGTELFWTNDDGVFVLPQRDVQAGGVCRQPDLRGAARALPLRDQASGRAARHPAAPPEPLPLQRMDREHRGLDGVHPDL